VGDAVVHIDRPDERGRIVDIVERDPPRYEIRFGNARTQLAEDALRAAPE
jgi:hypothetical protein